jgi:hypothetical protein
MAAICIPVLLICRIACSAGDPGLRAVYTAQSCVQGMIEVACERYCQKSKDQSKKNENRNKVNWSICFGWF